MTGAGEKETIFWKNYFFHCAHTRYEKGLSVDEIWSQKPKASIMTSSASEASKASIQHDMMDDDESSVELEFEDEDTTSNGDTTKQTESAPAANKEASSTTSPSAMKSTNSDTSGSANSYEVVNESASNIEENDLDDLDDLEAEIARELGEE